MQTVPETSSQPSINKEKQAKILEAARKRMLHYGVSKTTMSEIADDAQMAVGTIYLYFKNKDDIVIALAQNCRQEQEAFLQSILQNQHLDPHQKLETFLVEKYRYLKTWRVDPPHGKELTAYLIQNFPDTLTEWEHRFESALSSILRQGVEQGRFQIADVAQAAETLRLATMGFFPLPYIDLPKYPEEEDLMKVISALTVLWGVA